MKRKCGAEGVHVCKVTEWKREGRVSSKMAREWKHKIGVCVKFIIMGQK